MPQRPQQLLNRLTLRQLQVFYAVYNQGGYGKAAETLGLTQPAVSAQIRQLEDTLGQKLFEFIGRKLYRTAAGDMVAACTGRIFEQLTGLQNGIQSLSGQVAGELRIAVVNTAQYVVPYLLGAFLGDYPEVSPTVSVVNRARAIERLGENKDDLVIMGLVPSEKPLASFPFLDNELIPVMAFSDPLTSVTDISPQQFLSNRLILREKGSGSRLALEMHCQQQHLKLQPYMEIGSNDALKHAVIAGLGVAVLPRLSVLAELRLGSLLSPALDGFPLRRSWCLVYPANKSLTLVARRFMEYVQQNLAHINQQFAQLSETGR